MYSINNRKTLSNLSFWINSADCMALDINSKPSTDGISIVPLKSDF